LEDRTYEFALTVVLYTKKLPKTVSNIEYVKQVIRSSGSPAANYIEADELKRIFFSILNKRV
jgi:four helix bundle protein